MRILLSLFLLAAGTAMTIKSEWLYQNFGTIAFFEKYLHSSGGGRLGYKVMGMLAVLVGILVLTNIHEAILLAIAGLFTFGQTQ
jgi:hypothetical protein